MFLTLSYFLGHVILSRKIGHRTVVETITWYPTTKIQVDLVITNMTQESKVNIWTDGWTDIADLFIRSSNINKMTAHSSFFIAVNVDTICQS